MVLLNNSTHNQMLQLHVVFGVGFLGGVVRWVWGGLVAGLAGGGSRRAEGAGTARPI